MGVPAWFCDEIAYGKQTKEYRDSFRHMDPRYHQPSYCSAFACYGHGGPKEHAELSVFKDGNMWCAVKRDGFTNIQECVAAFGETPEKAIDQFYIDMKEIAA
jgi:hypothetical protein